MMFSRLLNQIDRIQLNKIATSLSELKDRLQEERAKMNGYAVRFKPYSKPVCGLECHGDYVIEKARLTSKIQACAHAISRDEAAYSARLERVQKLEQRIQRRMSTRRSVGFSPHRSASFH
jgi:hypothetical protein